MLEAQNRISTKAIRVFRLRNTLIEVLFLVIVVVLLTLGHVYEWFNWLIIIFWVLLGLVPLSATWSVIFEPNIIQKYWRYGINEQFVRLKHGRFVHHDIVIPMTKIQYVGADQGPLLRKYGLYSLTIGTLGSSHTIPALPEEEAFQIRDQIAHYAQIDEEDELNEQ